MSDNLASGSSSLWARLAGWLAVIALAVTVALVAYTGPAFQAGWIDLPTALFRLLRWIAYAGIACVVLGAIGAVWNLLSGSKALAAVSVVAMVVGGALAWNLYSWQQTAGSVPPIHDITTDVTDPPEFVDVLPLRANAPNPPAYEGQEIAQQQRAAYPDLEPIVLGAPVDQVFAAALDVVQRMGWELVGQAPDEGRIEATDTTRYFGFKDDVVIRIRDTAGGTVVDVRSKSRVGRSDVGTNAARIRDFRERLLQRVA